jgi:vancomycin resistance protein VanJ
VSVRLSPSVLQLDAKAQTQSRLLRRAELNAALVAVAPTGGVVFGGDLNVPAGDGALTPLANLGFSDAWPKAGLGWGNTIANDFPIHRIDQLWLRGLTPRALIAVPTQYSDHRMVVCDLVK